MSIAAADLATVFLVGFFVMAMRPRSLPLASGASSGEGSGVGGTARETSGDDDRLYSQRIMPDVVPLNVRAKPLGGGPPPPPNLPPPLASRPGGGGEPQRSA